VIAEKLCAQHYFFRSEEPEELVQQFARTGHGLMR
jgi:hypothetical protein